MECHKIYNYKITICDLDPMATGTPSLIIINNLCLNECNAINGTIFLFFLFLSLGTGKGPFCLKGMVNQCDMYKRYMRDS